MIYFPLLYVKASTEISDIVEKNHAMGPMDARLLCTGLSRERDWNDGLSISLVKSRLDILSIFIYILKQYFSVFLEKKKDGWCDGPFVEVSVSFGFMVRFFIYSPLSRDPSGLATYGTTGS